MGECSSLGDRGIPRDWHAQGGKRFPVVVDDVVEALRLRREGCDVVLIVTESAVVRDLGDEGPGRVAVFVGDPASPEVRDAARAMDEELFGRTSR